MARTLPSPKKTNVAHGTSNAPSRPTVEPPLPADSHAAGQYAAGSKRPVSSTLSSAGHTLADWAVPIVCVALALWRLGCVGIGPDPDTDAYGHYVIARQLLETPFNVSIHWVWLPLYHFLLALGVYAGMTLDHVRSSNAVLAAAIPLLLFWELKQHRRRDNPLDRAVPHLAAGLAAATPIAMELGTTGQMEVLFSLVLVVAAALARRGRHAWAALALSLAVLTRYEAWAVVAAGAAVFAARRVVAGVPIGAGALGSVLGPAACVLGWATLRWVGGEPWFGFIVDNQAFAEQALRPPASAGWYVAALGRYVVTAPLRLLGVVAVLSALGVRRTLREEGIWFVAPPLAVLAFLTLTSLTRSQLGLDRHFLAVVPFVATWAAHGIVCVAEWLGASYERLTARARGANIEAPSLLLPSTELGALNVTILSFVVISLCVAWSAFVRLDRWMGDWREVTRTALLDSRAAGRFLQTTPPTSVIVCDDASVEVLSGLEPARFARVRVGEGAIPHVLELSKSRDVIVMSRSSRVRALARWGSVVYGGGSSSGDDFMAVHVAAAHGHGGAAERGQPRR